VTFSNRGRVANPTPASGGDESGSGESVRLLWPGGNGVDAAPSVAAAPEAAEPDDLPFWDWSVDQSELDDPSDALAPDRPESPDGPDYPDYPDYRASASADPPTITPASQEPSGRPRRSERDQGNQVLRQPGQVVVTPVAVDQPRREGIGQHLGSLAHLSADPRRRVWVWRAVIAVVILVGLSIAGFWLLGLTLAVVVVIADTIIRSRRVFAGPAAVRQAAARRSTRRQLAKLERAGYRALHDIAIPGTEDQIDHLVIGPAGVFAIDSEAWDKRLPVRTRNARQLWHGPFSMEDRLEHARWESERAATRLSGALGSQVAVRPAMAVYGPKIHWDVANIRDVDVFRGPRLRRYLRRVARQKDTRLLPDGEVEKIDRAARTAFPHATVG
jgi:Nuclease-related domain